MVTGQVRCDHEDSDEEGNGDNGCIGMGTNIYGYRDNKKTQLTDSSSLSLLRVAGVAGHLQADEVRQSQTKDWKHNAF